MNDAQTWALIVGTLTIQAAVLALVLGTQTRWIKAEIGRLADKIEHLDRDVQRVVDRIFGEGR